MLGPDPAGLARPRPNRGGPIACPLRRRFPVLHFGAANPCSRRVPARPVSLRRRGGLMRFTHSRLRPSRRPRAAALLLVLLACALPASGRGDPLSISRHAIADGGTGFVQLGWMIVGGTI